jgi:cation transport ATPase
MTRARTHPSTAPTPPPRVSWTHGVVLLHDDRLFGPGGERACERFLGRILSVEGVRSVSLDRSKGTAAIRHQAVRGEVGRFVRELAVALRDGGGSGSFPTLPRGVREPTCTIYRHGPLLTTCAILRDQPGDLRLRHGALRRDRVLARRVILLLETFPGVLEARIGGWSGNLALRYDPEVVGTYRLVRLVEEAMADNGGWDRSLPEPARSGYGLTNTTLGIAAAADFALPALAPVSAVLLVGTNLRTFRAAGLQVWSRKFGLPVLYSVIVAATLASGQFFASALMSWFFRFWQGRLRVELAAERRRLLDECLPLPRRACRIAPDGKEIMVPVDRLRPGDRIMVRVDDPVPADGRVLEGGGIVDERSVRGLAGASRKRPGDALLAGSTILAGSMRVEVARPRDRTRASSIVRAVVAATSPDAGPASPTHRSREFADKAVGPTLATAGVGLLVAELAAVGAILRPDYVTGTGMAVSLETLRNAALCSQRGIVIRAADVFERLGEVDLIVLDDVAALQRFALEVEEIQTRLPETELLRFAASAFRHLADDRASALAGACRERQVYLLDLPPVGFDPGVTVSYGRHRIRVRDDDPNAEGTGPLLVEIDGMAVGLIRFRRSARREATAALERIRASAQTPVALVSDRRQAEIAPLVRTLGLETYQGSLSPEDMARLLRACRERGLRTAFVGDGRRHARAAAEAHVAVSFADDADFDSDSAAVLLLQPRLDLFADLWEIARSHTGRVLEDQKLVLIPNVFCVAGAFLFGFSGLTAVMISNLGTFGLYSRAVGSLRELEPPRLSDRRTPAYFDRWESTEGPAEFRGDEPSRRGGTEHPDHGAWRAEGPGLVADRAASDDLRPGIPQEPDESGAPALKTVPREVGVMLLAVGVLGFVLPGVMGTPAIIAGGLALWPGAFGKVEGWFGRRFPRLHRRGMDQVGRYLDDLERRFPELGTTEAG